MALVLFAGIAALGAPCASAQERDPGWGWQFDVAPVYRGRTDLEGGGDYAVDSLLLRFRGKRPVSRRLLLGFSVSLDYAEYDFSSPSGLGGGTPWDDIERVTVGAPLFYGLGGGWSLFAIPSISSAREQGAELSDSWIVGTIIGGAKQINPRLLLGVGAGLFTGLEQVRWFIFPSVTWQINDRLTLTNPFRAGPTGPAGLELRWAFAPRWQFAGGAAQRSVRFRLDETGTAPRGVGQDSALYTFLRVTRDWGEALSLDLYAGAALDGELQLENDSGTAIARDDYDPAPIAALVLRSRF